MLQGLRCLAQMQSQCHHVNHSVPPCELDKLPIHEHTHTHNGQLPALTPTAHGLLQFTSADACCTACVGRVAVLLEAELLTISAERMSTEHDSP